MAFDYAANARAMSAQSAEDARLTVPDLSMESMYMAWKRAVRGNLAQIGTMLQRLDDFVSGVVAGWHGMQQENGRKLDVSMRANLTGDAAEIIRNAPGFLEGYRDLYLMWGPGSRKRQQKRKAELDKFKFNPASMSMQTFLDRIDDFVSLVPLIYPDHLAGCREQVLRATQLDECGMDFGPVRFHIDNQAAGAISWQDIKRQFKDWHAENWKPSAKTTHVGNVYGAIEDHREPVLGGHGQAGPGPGTMEQQLEIERREKELRDREKAAEAREKAQQEQDKEKALQQMLKKVKRRRASSS